MHTQIHHWPIHNFLKTSGAQITRKHVSGMSTAAGRLSFAVLCILSKPFTAGEFPCGSLGLFPLSVMTQHSSEQNLPRDFPTIELNLHGGIYPGKLFFASTFSDSGNYIIILNEDGTPYFYRRFQKSYHGTEHFELQPNGMLTFYSFTDKAVYVMSSQFDLVDTFKCVPPYEMDSHEFQYLENNHALFIAEELEKVDMSSVIEGGQTSAWVRFEHVLELDENRNILLDWSSRDHLDIRDAIHEDLRQMSINPVNFNSLAEDYDGHIILSVRNYDEIIKIHRETGAIIWRLGGQHSSFTFADKSDRFCYQHDARPVPGKPDHYTLFDNGNFKNPHFSRAVEYFLDTEHMTAEKVWEFRMTPDRYSFMMGSVQTLPNGNRIIDMSNFPPLYTMEVSPSGECLSELSVAETSSPARLV
jgi:hypothetical protein